MLRSQKNIFWEALIITIFIFGIGILLGIFIENGRVGKISDMYLESEIDLLDIRVQSEIMDVIDLDCDLAIQKNIEFGDRIFEDAKIVQRYEDAARISDSLIEQHRKYDLLRTLFWVNSIKIKEKCEDKFHTVVYIYDYEPERIKETSKQKVFSNFLIDLKKTQGSNVVLIPIAGNMGLSSTETLIKKYNIESFPVVLVDEDYKAYEIEELSNIFPLIE